jgi:hypothetical protein
MNLLSKINIKIQLNDMFYAINKKNSARNPSGNDFLVDDYFSLII